MAKTLLDLGKLSEVMNLALMDKEAVMNVFYATPGLKKIMAKEKTVAGSGLQQPVVVKELETHSYITGESYGVGVPDCLKDAQWKFHKFDVDCSLPQSTVSESKSEDALVNLVETYRDIGLRTGTRDLWKMILGLTPPGVTDPTASIPDIANVDRSYGGINSTTFEAWDGYRFSASTKYSVSSVTTLVASNLMITILDDLITEISDAGPGDSCDAIIVGPLMWRALGIIATAAFAPIKIDGTVAWGPNSFTHRNVDIVLDKNLPDSQGYIEAMNFDYLDVVFSNGYNFDFKGFTEDPNSDKLIGHILFSAELVCTQPRRQGLITGLPTTYS